MLPLEQAIKNAQNDPNIPASQKAAVIANLRNAYAKQGQTGQGITKPTTSNTSNIFGQLDDPQMSRLISLLPDELKGVLNSLSNSVVKKIESGQIINPNIKITPKESRKLLKQAESEIEPYYKEQIGFIRKDLENSLSKIQSDYETFANRATEDFSLAQQSQAEREAQSGTAFSSARDDRRRTLANQQQRTLDDAANYAEQSGRAMTTAAERAIGSKAVSKYGTIPLYSAGNNGISKSGSKTFAQAGGNVVGSLEKAKEADLKRRQSELESSFRTSRNLDLSGLGY